jgi:hypothetical protein
MFIFPANQGAMKNLIFCLAVAAPTLLFAQSPFDGTWKTMMDQSKFSRKPIIFYVKDGIYDTSSTVPKIHVTADGQDQPVTGQSYDTIAVKEIDAHTIQFVLKKNGKISSESTRTVSEDGKTLTVKSTSHPPDSDKTTTAEVTATRVEPAPPGAHAASGSWRLQKVDQSENALLATYKRNGEELTYSDPTGETWTAKPDGQDYPVKGTYGTDSVSLKQIDDHTIEASFKRGGKLIEVNKITVSPDGNKMTMVDKSVLTGRVSTYFADKQ